MKKPRASKVKEPEKKGGKRSLYSPELGTGNYRKAQEGRFADHPAFRACKTFIGVGMALENMLPKAKSNNLIVRTLATQVEKALNQLAEESKKLKKTGDKIRFAEAIAAVFDRQKGPDQTTMDICWTAKEMRTKSLGEYPSKAELRAEVKRKYNLQLSAKEWGRLFTRTGLNKILMSRAEKAREDT